MSYLIRFFALLAIILHVCYAGSRRGDGTAYSGKNQIDKTGKNACQLNARRLPSRWRQYYAALNARDWQGGRHCGKCLKVKGRKGTVIVKVVDLCPAWACPKKTGHSVDLSSDALKAATGYYWDRKPITWDFVKCPQ